MKLVLLPGLDGTGDLLAKFLKETPENWKAQVISYPSDTSLTYQEYADFVFERLPERKKFLLLGESFSGPVSIQVAARSPRGLEGLVLCNTFALRPAWSGFRLLPWRTIFRRPIPKFTVGRLLTGFALAGRWLDPIREANRRVTPEVLASRMRSVITLDVRDALLEIEVPILDLRGSRDRLVGLRSERKMRRARPDIHGAQVEGPHMILQTAPRCCWQAIERFAHEVCDFRGDGSQRPARATEYPSNEPSSEKRAGMMWSEVGRAMFGEQPDDK